jgi:hypothetical protein
MEIAIHGVLQPGQRSTRQRAVAASPSGGRRPVAEIQGDGGGIRCGGKEMTRRPRSARVRVDGDDLDDWTA